MVKVIFCTIFYLLKASYPLEFHKNIMRESDLNLLKKKAKSTLEKLILANKEELLKDSEEMEKIERRIEDKHIQSNQ